MTEEQSHIRRLIEENATLERELAVYRRRSPGLPVQVTRDTGGIVIWREGAQLAYDAPKTRGLKMQSRWSAYGLFRRNVIFGEEDTRICFPWLEDVLAVGERRIMKLQVHDA